MLVYSFVRLIFNNPYLLFYDSSGHASVTLQNLSQLFMNLFDHEDLESHLLQKCP